MVVACSWLEKVHIKVISHGASVEGFLWVLKLVKLLLSGS